LLQLPVGLDSVCATRDNRIFISNHLDGSIREVRADRYIDVVAQGWLGPLDLAMRPSDGALWVADGLSLAKVSAGTVQRPLHFGQGIRPTGVVCAGDAVFMLSSGDHILRYADNDSSTKMVQAGDGKAGMLNLESRRSLFAFDDHHVGVIDRKNGHLTRLAVDGTTAPIIEALVDPVAACRDGSGATFVLQRGGTELLSIDTFGAARKLAEFQAASSIACSGDWLLITDVGKRQIVGLHKSGGHLVVVLDGAPIGPVVPDEMKRTTDSASVCDGGNGSFYAGLGGDGSIREISRNS
jgi:hypothetical protein